MSACDLTLELDGEEPHEAGSTISGRLVVVANDDAKIDGTKVELWFETHGWGSDHRSEPVTWAGEGLSLARGERREIPFAIGVPSEPITFEGELVGVVWKLRAELDVPWAFDPTTEREVVVGSPKREALADTVAEDAESDGDEPASRAPAPRRDDALKSFVPYLVLGVLAVTTYLLRTASPGAKGGGPGSAFWLFLAIAVVFLSYRTVLNHLAAKGVGTPTVVLSDAQPRRGRDVDVTVTLEPPGKAEIARVVATLTYHEVVTRGGGRNQRSKRHEVEADLAVLAEHLTVARGGWNKLHGKLRVPESMAPTFSAPGSNVSWLVTVRVVPKSGLDHVTEMPLVVQA